MTPGISQCRFDHMIYYILVKVQNNIWCQSKLTEEANADGRC